MLFKRSRLAELEPARRALAEGQYEVAFALLENAARRPWSRATQAQYLLHLAAVYALYGSEGAEGGSLALKDAARADTGVTRQPLYSALFWEFAAVQGESLADVKRGVRRVATGDEPVARYHAASALLAAGALKSVVRTLEPLEGRLPEYLEWRRWSLIGQAHEGLANWHDATTAFTTAVDLCSGPERESERLSLAACHLETGAAGDALAVLAAVAEGDLYPDDVAFKRYLEGRAELERGNPNHALRCLFEAASLNGSAESFGLSFAFGQCYAALGRFDEAVDALFGAVATASSEYRTHARHELAYVLMEADRNDEALDLLADVLGDPDYPHQGDAFADFAECHFKLGALDEAAQAASAALELGSVALACATLGNVAYEYYRLDEAATWFEQAAAASNVGESVWVSAQQMLADIFSQQGPSGVERMHHHARAALAYTGPTSDWYLPLQRYLSIATESLGETGRVLN